jgi:hypothetical protein
MRERNQVGIPLFGGTSSGQYVLRNTLERAEQAFVGREFARLMEIYSNRCNQLMRLCGRRRARTT